MGAHPTVSAYAFAPYCGAPPSSATLWIRWNLDPFLIVALLGLAAGYAVFVERSGEVRTTAPWRRACFYAGWALGSVALISPLCALSVSLFSARVGQHMLLTTLVAPLIALGWSWRTASPRSELFAATAFFLSLWIWHAPGPYAATFNGWAVYWLMHLTLFGSAVWFWKALFDAPPERTAVSVAAALAVSLQMALLGAIITFADRAIYAPHALTTAAWGFTPLADQQLGGVIMWVPAGVIFVAAIMTSLAALMRRPAARASLSAGA